MFYLDLARKARMDRMKQRLAVSEGSMAVEAEYLSASVVNPTVHSSFRARRFATPRNDSE